jgi:ketosteroid isomerase-like protein
MKLFALLLLLFSPLMHAQENSLQEQVLGHERQELDAVRNADYKSFSDLIADDAVFLDPHGEAGKKEVVEHVADFKLLDYTISDVHFLKLSNHSGLVAYKLVQHISAGGHDFTKTLFASAVWEQRDGHWVTLFSQETPAK